MAIAEAGLSRRALSKERRRLQLIDATIKCISDKGLSGLTLADVAKEAGLSQGIINLHFNSKDNLLGETLRYLVEDYDAQFTQTVDSAEGGPAAALLALMEMDLKPSICDRKKLAVWFAFWGEAKAVPTYQKICAAYDNKFSQIILGLCERIVVDGKYRDVDPQIVADALSSLTDGLWLTALVNPKAFDRHAALRCVLSYLSVVFPDHYNGKST